MKMHAENNKKAQLIRQWQTRSREFSSGKRCCPRQPPRQQQHSPGRGEQGLLPDGEVEERKGGHLSRGKATESSKYTSAGHVGLLEL